MYPFLFGNYMHEMELNLLAMQLKLLELFNPHYEVIGTEADMVFRLAKKANVLEGEVLREVRWEASETGRGFYSVNTSRDSFSNVSAIVYCNSSKEVSKDTKEYFVSEVEGELDPKFYGLGKDMTLPQYIYSAEHIGVVRKLCLKCRRDRERKYLVSSKYKLSDQYLRMFRTHEVLNWTRHRVTKFVQPELARFTDGNGQFFVNPVFTVSDSRELSLSVVDSVTHLIELYLA